MTLRKSVPESPESIIWIHKFSTESSFEPAIIVFKINGFHLATFGDRFRDLLTPHANSHILGNVLVIHTSHYILGTVLVIHTSHHIGDRSRDSHKLQHFGHRSRDLLTLHTNS